MGGASREHRFGEDVKGHPQLSLGEHETTKSKLGRTALLLELEPAALPKIEANVGHLQLASAHDFLSHRSDVA